MAFLLGDLRWTVNFVSSPAGSALIRSSTLFPAVMASSIGLVASLERSRRTSRVPLNNALSLPRVTWY